MREWTASVRRGHAFVGRGRKALAAGEYREAYVFFLEAAQSYAVAGMEPHRDEARRLARQAELASNPKGE